VQDNPIYAGYLDPNFKPNKDWWGSTPTRD
jgi:hypothetical protein